MVREMLGRFVAWNFLCIPAEVIPPFLSWNETKGNGFISPLNGNHLSNMQLITTRTRASRSKANGVNWQVSASGYLERKLFPKNRIGFVFLAWLQ